MRRAVPSMLCLGLVLACDARFEPVGELPPAAAPQPGASGALVVAHGGQGSPASRSDGPAVATAAVLAALAAGSDVMAAAMAGIEVMEDDPRFNAGTGANLRLDGKTIQCDAAIMDDTGRFGAIAGIDGIKNPIRVARAVVDSPHIFLAGPGAQSFADGLGLPRADLDTDRARKKLERGMARLFDPERSPWGQFDWRRHWNFPSPAPTDPRAAAPPTPDAEAPETKDTVGVVLRTADGHYVAALSTGGTTLALNGRVGDVPQLGAGLYAGPAGAVAATGKGEEITRSRVAHVVYELLVAGVHPQAAIQRVIPEVRAGAGVGIIAVSERGFGSAATTQMAWAAQPQDGDAVRGDTVVWK